MKLADCLDKHISAFCANKFTDDGDNHCAHFVAHCLQLGVGYTCRAHKNGSAPGACLRGHELFDFCPQVSATAMAPGGFALAFVTAKSNVDLAGHKMRNVPQKHVGIYDGSHIYNYSNTQHKVVRQTPADFLARFEAAYDGVQGLYFGSLPPAAVLPEGAAAPAPAPAPAAVPPAAGAALVPTIREQTAGGKTDYFASLPGVPEYYLARKTKYESFVGLFQPGTKLYGPRFAAADFAQRLGPVAGLLEVIATGESSGYFNRINSYDRAAMTFGFFQLAAHTPQDNLVLLLRRLATDSPAFRSLFPDLSVRDGLLQRAVGGHSVSLETGYPRAPGSDELVLRDLMAYLNGDLTVVDGNELSVAARLVHLANSDPHSNALQASVAADISMRKLRQRYDPWYGLDGASDLVCTAIADIHHQGRGTKTQVRAALAAGGTVAQQLAGLCKIGIDNYAERCATLKAALKKAQDSGALGISVFDRASGLLRPAGGWPA